MTDHVNITLPHFANNTRNSNIQVGKVLVGPNDSVRNLGVMFDAHLRMKDHINTICKCSYYHLQSIRYLESFLSPATLETTSMSSSHLDWTTATHCCMAFLITPLGNYNTFKTAQPGSSPTPKNRNILHLFFENYIGCQ